MNYIRLIDQVQQPMIPLHLTKQGNGMTATHFSTAHKVSTAPRELTPSQLPITVCASLVDIGSAQDLSTARPANESVKPKGRGFFRTVKLWLQRSQQRRQLRELQDNADFLKDIGRSGYEVYREGRKPFWRE